MGLPRSVDWDLGGRRAAREVPAKLTCERRNNTPILTPRQEQLAALLSEGKSLSEIAKSMHLAYGTTKQYMTQIFLRTGIQSRSEFLGWYRRSHMLQVKPVVIQQPLTPRESRLIVLLNEGHTNKTIASMMNTTESTIKVMVFRVMRKTNTVSRTQFIGADIETEVAETRMSAFE